MNGNNHTLTAYFPRGTSASVTGTRCDLMCEHCKSRHLRGMTDVSCADKMLRFIDGVIASGGKGILMSGGCDINGSVPIMRHIGAIEYASKNGLAVNVHTGFVTADDANLLVKAGVNAFSADIHQDPVIIRNVLHLNAGAEAYAEMLDNIISAGGRPVPHLTVGFGTDDLLLSAELVKSKGLKDVVILALVPTKGTITEDTLVSEDAILSAVGLLTELGLNVTLGCMRPRVHRDLEIGCIRAGVRKIANPSRRTLFWARDNGLAVEEERTCCCIIR